MRILTDGQRAQFFEQGYLVVENLVPADARAAVLAAIGAFLGIDPDAPGDWHRHRLEGHGIVPLHHHPALWNVRQLPAVHAAFADLYDDERLWVTMDRVSFKPPRNGFDGDVRTDAIHWDGDPGAGRRLRIQGLVYLSDTRADEGPFCCVPDLYRALDNGWLEAHPDEIEQRRPDVSGFDIVPVPGAAGSMVLWNRRLPHSSLVNDGTRPRAVQYVAMDREGADSERPQRIDDFLSRRAPGWALKQKVPGQVTPEPVPPARLSALGAKLAGIEPW